MEHLTLPALDESETQEVSKEVVEVEAAEHSCWRLLHSPAFVWGVARGDVIRLNPDVLRGFDIVKRSGNLAVVVSLPSGQEVTARRTLEPEIVEVGGVCEGGPPRMLVFSVPVSVGFPRIQAIFDRACGRVPEMLWWFGNVYGPDDKSLDWWLK
jgi:hypothetical protein